MFGGGYKIRTSKLITKNTTIPTKKSEIYDARGKMVTPSFVNAHTHLAMNAFRGMDFSRASETNIIEDGFFRVERKLSQEDVLALCTIWQLWRNLITPAFKKFNSMGSGFSSMTKIVRC